jgi:hypothetical protein
MAELRAAMGISEEAAKKRVQRAVLRLRQIMVKKGTAVGAAGLVTAMASQLTQAAPAGLVESTLAASTGAAKGTAAGMIAHSAGRLFWWAKMKLAAMVLLVGAGGAATCGIIVYALPTQSASTSTPLAAPAPAPINPVSLPLMPTTASTDFGPLYEKAQGSSPGLSMNVGPNTFAITAVVRYFANGKPLATDGRGKVIDSSTLPPVPLQDPAGTSNDIIIVYLKPGPDRYDIDRLRLFDHMTRQYISDVIVTPLPGLSALQISANPGSLPRSIDLWLDVASYGPDNVAVDLPAKKDATVAVGGATVGFRDIRDGEWDFNGDKFVNPHPGLPSTSMQLKSTGNWNVGRYQISAVSKSGQKYLSDFFIVLSGGEGLPMSFPFALDGLDHFSLRPLAHEPPFFFDGIDLPDVGSVPAKTNVAVPEIIDAGGQYSVPLPCGATVELMGIGNYPEAKGGWWGIDGLPVSLSGFTTNGSISDNNGAYTRRLFAARLLDAPEPSSGLLWQIDQSAGYAGGGSDEQNCMMVALRADAPATVRLGVGSTPWKTVEEIPANSLPAQAKNGPAVLQSLKPSGDGVLLEAIFSELPTNARLVLIDRAGKPHTINGYSSMGRDEKLAPWGYQSAGLTFNGLRLEDIRGIALQTRREEYAEFKNVPLHPK